MLMGCDSTINYQRQAVTQDGAGGKVKTFATIAPNLRAGIFPASYRISGDFARRDDRVTHTIMVDADLLKINPQDNDLVVNPATSQTFIVHGSFRWSNKMIQPTPFYELYCELVTI